VSAFETRTVREEQLMPAGAVQQDVPPSPQELGQLRAFAVCMRAHDIDMSDPDPKTGNMTTGHATQATGPRLSTALGVRVKVAGEQMVGQDVELVATNQPEEDRPVYERLPGDALEGDDQLFASEDIVEAEPQVVEPVMGDATPVYGYEPGTWGPEEADQLIGEGGWSNPAGRERRPP
jgi:hypothetical protein